MILPDLGLLRRRRDLRLMVGGSTVSSIGTQFTQVALAVHVFDLTDSTVAVGLIGIAQFIPIIALALIGGALADSFDRRKLIFGAELASGFISAVLLVNALLPDPQLWVLYVAATLFAAASAVLRPPLDALLPRLVERDELKAASAISWSLMSVSGIVGPALAGLVIAAGGVETAYAIDVVSFVGSLTAFALMRTPPPPPDAEPPSLRGVVEGIRYAGSRQEILGSYVIDIHAMFFGMPFALSRQWRSATAGRRSSACCGRRPRSVRSSPCSRPAGACACTTTGARSCGPRRAGARSWRCSGSRTRCGSRWSRWPSRAPPTPSAASSAARSGTRRSRTACAAAWQGWR
ncbi:MFS transporter [Solirubrobacter sp. CPCC 204708]|uniref:MFS transporter n=1 Tax=Solirubrobacter deserti TaxID=2282478 RepID=A0ABT4RUG5_9ACTN|nr:MFS transporter [Solirubrobacter deserti]MBE2320180.1 MFS transporter [Solirubrobacter deserti]MDA0142227.1 MFS transporter [Solirubrobacter deserti]